MVLHCLYYILLNYLAGVDVSLNTYKVLYNFPGSRLHLLVDFSPTFYCLPKPLFLYGSMVLFIIDISIILLTMYYSGYIGL